MSDMGPIAAMLTELGYLSEAEAIAMTGLRATRLREARLSSTSKSEDARGRLIKDDGLLLGSEFGSSWIYPRWNVTEFINQEQIKAARKADASDAIRALQPTKQVARPVSKPTLAFHDAGPSGLFILSTDLSNGERQARGPFRTVSKARSFAAQHEHDCTIDWKTFPADADQSTSV